MDEFGANFVTLTDDDGVSYEMEILARFELEDREYVALAPVEGEDEDEAAELEVNILRVTQDGDEETLETIADEAEREEAYEALMQLVFEDEEEE